MVGAATRGVNTEFSAAETRGARRADFDRSGGPRPRGTEGFVTRRAAGERLASGRRGAGTTRSLRAPVPLDSHPVPLQRAGDGGVGAHVGAYELERAHAGRASPTARDPLRDCRRSERRGTRHGGEPAL